MTPPRFEPFQDRLSRDIRNELSAALPLALAQNDLAPVRVLLPNGIGNKTWQLPISPISRRDWQDTPKP